MLRGAICSVCSMQIIYHQWKLCLSFTRTTHCMPENVESLRLHTYTYFIFFYSIIFVSLRVASIYLELWNIVAWFHRERAIWLLEISLWGAAYLYTVSPRGVCLLRGFSIRIYDLFIILNSICHYLFSALYEMFTNSRLYCDFEQIDLLYPCNWWFSLCVLIVHRYFF